MNFDWRDYSGRNWDDIVYNKYHCGACFGQMAYKVLSDGPVASVFFDEDNNMGIVFEHFKYKNTTCFKIVGSLHRWSKKLPWKFLAANNEEEQP